MNSLKLDRVESHAFSHFKNLKCLRRTHSGLIEIESNALNGLTKLKQLELSNSRLRSIPPGLFDGLVNLEELFLHENDLRKLSADLFVRLVKLKRLNLGWNAALADLDESRLHGLGDLTELTLTGTPFSTLCHPFVVF
jgi:Leucine-rich repeat (LRR) protein